LANSNAEDEKREGVTVLGDKCDPVPLTVSRPEGSGTVGVTFFASTAGLGTGGVGSTLASAHYRFCSCFSGNTTLSRAACIATQCPAARNAFSGDHGEWQNVSLATSTGLTPGQPPAQSGFTLGLQTSDLYTSDVQCNDTSPHPGNVTETCRVGAAQRTLMWSSAADVAAGNVSGRTGGQVAGMFLSHVLQNAGTPSFTSARDSTSQGNLRTDYEYLGAAETPPPATVAVGLVNPLLGCVACAAIWRNDWASDPVDFEPAPGIFRQISFPGRILPFGNARFAMLGDVLNPVYEVTGALSAGVRSLLGQTGLRFLSPSETGARGIQSAARLQFVALPQQWRQSAVRPVAVVGTAGQLQTLQEATGGEPIPRIARAAAASAPPAPPHFVPGDRDGAGAILAGREGNMFLIGGHRTTGQLTGEVWQYDLGADVWTHLFKNGVAQPLPGDVRAAAYDDLRHRMVVLDVVNANNSQEPANGLNLSGMRLLSLDTATETSTTLAALPVADTTSTFVMAADNDGTFILVKQPAGLAVWVARRFKIVSQQAIVCLGELASVGTVVDNPIHTTNGIFLPVVIGGVQSLATLSPGNTNNGTADDGLGCPSP
jgi:hypothetical protein